MNMPQQVIKVMPAQPGMAREVIVGIAVTIIAALILAVVVRKK